MQDQNMNLKELSNKLHTHTHTQLPAQAGTKKGPKTRISIMKNNLPKVYIKLKNCLRTK